MKYRSELSGAAIAAVGHVFPGETILARVGQKATSDVASSFALRERSRGAVESSGKLKTAHRERNSG